MIFDDDALYEDVNDDVFEGGNGSGHFGVTGNDVPSSPRWFENHTDYTEYDQVILIFLSTCGNKFLNLQRLTLIHLLTYL
jgi:hypothetical protein